MGGGRGSVGVGVGLSSAALGLIIRCRVKLGGSVSSTFCLVCQLISLIL